MRVALEESRQPRAGGETILAKVSELMFLHAVRQYIDSLPDDSTGWLAALRDRYVERRFTRDAREACRTVDARYARARSGPVAHGILDRFSEVMGMPAIQYLSNWRLQLAAGLLDRQGMSIAQVAADVGFGSEAAFNRAFKRQVGMPPGAWRLREPSRRLSVVEAIREERIRIRVASRLGVEFRSRAAAAAGAHR